MSNRQSLNYSLMDRPEHKYRLHSLMDMLPRSIEVRTIEGLLLTHYGIPAATFRRHKNLPFGVSTEITEGTLAKYASFFGVSVDELRNYQLEERGSIFELLDMRQRAGMKDLARLAKMSFPSAEQQGKLFS